MFSFTEFLIAAWISDFCSRIMEGEGGEREREISVDFTLATLYSIMDRSMNLPIHG